jgi:hypothetical protein
MRRTLGGSSGVPPGIVTHVPLMQVPVQARLQPPQWTLLVFVSTQAFPHSICPDAEQPQVPALQTEPAGHALSQEPQLSALFIVSMHAPVPHIVSPVAHIDWQELPLQTWPAAHLLPQPPQLFASGGMQAPPQASRPALHWHWLAWQVWPAPQAWPHEPQFCGSDVRSRHSLPHFDCPLVH